MKEEMNKLVRIINLSLDIDENQKKEWIKLIASLDYSKDFNLDILINEIINININDYNAIFQKKINNLSKKNIVKYSVLALEYVENKNIDTALAFLENFNANIQKIEPSFVQRLQRLKEKKGILCIRQRSLKFTKDKLFQNTVEKRMNIK